MPPLFGMALKPGLGHSTVKLLTPMVIDLGCFVVLVSKVVGIGPGGEFIYGRPQICDLTRGIHKAEINGCTSTMGRWGARIGTRGRPKFIDPWQEGLTLLIGEGGGI